MLITHAAHIVYNILYLDQLQGSESILLPFLRYVEQRMTACSREPLSLTELFNSPNQIRTTPSRNSFRFGLPSFLPILAILQRAHQSQPSNHVLFGFLAVSSPAALKIALAPAVSSCRFQAQPEPTAPSGLFPFGLQ